MSVETNENLNKNNENVNKIEETKVVDMQATQRIEILGDFLKNEEKEPKDNPEVKSVPEEVVASNEQENNQVEVTENDTIDSQNNNPVEEQHTQDKKDYHLEKLLFDRINAMQGKIKESLELIKKFERINAKEENLPNIVTTLHDKLTQEVIKQFRTVNIEFNMKSYLVQSVVSDLLGKFEEGITEFKECSENLNFVKEVQDDFESRVGLAPTNSMRTFIARLRGFFKPEKKQASIEQLERERQEKKLEEANIHLIKYRMKDTELKKYTIRKDIVNSLTKETLYGKSSGLNLSVSEFIEQRISPEMKKLGLLYLNEGLEDSLYKGFMTKNGNIEKEDFMKMHVGDVKRRMKDEIRQIRPEPRPVVAFDAKEEEDRAEAL